MKLAIPSSVQHHVFVFTKKTWERIIEKGFKADPLDQVTAFPLKEKGATLAHTLFLCFCNFVSTHACCFSIAGALAHRVTSRANTFERMSTISSNVSHVGGAHVTRGGIITTDFLTIC
ncbi:unnamed protein product [Ectocarpus sp. 12 AP-2014]